MVVDNYELAVNIVNRWKSVENKSIPRPFCSLFSPSDTKMKHGKSVARVDVVHLEI